MNPDAFVSIHCNAIADDPETPQDEREIFNGFEVYYRDDGDKPLADKINYYLARTGLRNRGVLQDVAHLGKRLTVLNSLEVPSVLVELGFLTNKRDLEYLQENVEGVAELVGHGIIDFLETSCNTSRARGGADDI
jgi:N-acetylmuramoyl-L-alanine amidase